MGENPDSNQLAAQPVGHIPKPRIYRPDDKDQALYGFLRQKAEEGVEKVSFHEIQKGLNWTAGALQATINRCLKEDSPNRIYEATAYSDKNKRLTRVFSLNPFRNAAPVSNLKGILEQQQKLLAGDLIEIEDKIILPLKLDKETVELLKIIPQVAPEIKSVPALFREALSIFLKEHLSADIKKKAFIVLKERRTQLIHLNKEMYPMPDDEIIRLDPNEFEKMLSDNAVKRRSTKSPGERKKKLEPPGDEFSEYTEKDAEIEASDEDSEEILNLTPRKNTKSASHPEKKEIDADTRQLFGEMDNLIRKATIKSITKTLKDLQSYLDHDSEALKNESNSEEHRKE